MNLRPLKKFIYKHYFKHLEKRVLKMKNNPIVSQQAVYKNFLSKASRTQYGKDHGITPAMTYEEFKKNVPLNDYEDLLPYILKTKNGEEDILWPGKPIYFATTSGTTSGEKYIPVTKEWLKSGMASSILCTSTYLSETDNFDPLFRKMVILSANPKLNKDKFFSIGKITGIFNNHLPNFLKTNRIPSVATNSIEDWDEKMQKTVEESIGQDVGMVGGFPGWIIRYFERILEKTGKRSISDVFPNLQIITHGGVAYGPYKKRLETLIGKKFNRLEVYSASEGFIAFQDQQNKDDLLLVTDGEVFYEFVPLNEMGKKNPTRVSLKDVEVGVTYAVIMNTTAGLYGYIIGDTVTFTCTSPYRLKVSGRVKHFISNSGEHLISEQVEQALERTVSQYHTEVLDFSVAPHITDEVGGNRHQWLIEFENVPHDLQAFSSTLNQELCALSDNYKMMFESSILYPPIVTPLEKGAFVSYMKSINKMTNQNKVPRLMNHRELADPMLDWALKN